jgi:hypothetical protein
MQCQMPNCNNESTKHVCRKGIYCGIAPRSLSFHVCDDHAPASVNNEIDNKCEQEAMDSQMVNPFVDVVENTRFLPK